MKAIRRFLTKLLGVENYLFLISAIYIRMISLNFFKKKYPEIHFLKTIIQPDYVAMDIGANLGYYSTVLSRQASKGKVYCVEPIPLFVKVWRRNTRSCKNVQMFQMALGSEKQQVKMVIPIKDGIVRHGLSKVVDETSAAEHNKELSFDVQMDKGDETFKDLEKLDFMKCDIEGFEQFAIASLINVIKKHRPIIQIELNGDENRKNVYSNLVDNGFNAFILKDNALLPVDEQRLLDYSQDFYFVDKQNIKNYSFIKG